MKQNGHLCENITSPFTFWFIIYFFLYFTQCAMDYRVFMETYLDYYSMDQYFIMVLGCILSTVYNSTIYTLASLIAQQYQQLNNKLEDFCNDDNTNDVTIGDLSGVYRDLFKENESFNAGFGLYILCKLLTTYACFIISLYYLFVVPNVANWMILFWIFCMISEIVLIVYYCDWIGREVRILQRHLLV